MSVIASALPLSNPPQLPILPEKQEEFNRFLLRGKPPHDYEKQLIEKHSDRIKAIFRGEVIPPYEVEIQPAAHCNLTCELKRKISR
jgi:hypothetical protein